MYVPHLLYPFLCPWTFRLLPCLGYCEQCCSEHWGACIFSSYGFEWFQWFQLWPRSGTVGSYGSTIMFLICSSVLWDDFPMWMFSFTHYPCFLAKLFPFDWHRRMIVLNLRFPLPVCSLSFSKNMKCGSYCECVVQIWLPSLSSMAF